MWRFSNVLRLCCHFKSSRKLPGLTAHTVSSQRSGFQEYELLTSITVDTVAVHSMQWAGPGLSTGSHVERKEGIPPPPHSPPTPPALHSLVNRNGPQNKNQTNQRSPDGRPWDEGTKQLVEMVPRGKVALFVCHTKRYFLDVVLKSGLILYFLGTMSLLLSSLCLCLFLHDGNYIESIRFDGMSHLYYLIFAMWKSLSHVRLFATPWTIQSMEFSRPKYWTGWPFLSPGDLPNPGTEPRSPTLQVDSLSVEPPGKP